MERLILHAEVTEQRYDRHMVDFVQAFEELRQLGYTGRVVVDLAEGKPRRLELPNPVSVSIRLHCG